VHGHGGAGVEPAVLLPFAAALAAYLAAVVQERRRERSWPLARTVSWVAGVLLVLAAATLPAPGRPFVAHMGVHLVTGMLAPLLLVGAAPVTLALRALDVVRARQLARLLRSVPVRLVSHPVTAAALGAGSLVVLYRTPLLARMLADPAVHALVLTHVLASGCLLTAALVGPDPAPHRPGPWTRAAVLVLAVAAHRVTATWLYADPPAGVATADAEDAAVLMSYGGDAVHLALAVLLCGQWYRAVGRRRERDGARALRRAPVAGVV
jgi:putative membrane protein